MKILVSGSTGLLGSALVESLRADNHHVVRLVRGQANSSDEVSWDSLDASLCEGVEAVFHLSGEPVLGRWSEEKKKRIYDSRINSTRALSQAIAGAQNPPKYFGCASAIGIYGDRGNEIVDESSASGGGFLALVCRDWESATQAATDAGVRVVHYRIGVVLSKDGGALKTMLLPFSLGLGGAMGSGNQWLSWISRDDLIAAMRFCLQDERIHGAVNLVAPNPVTNRQFARTLGRTLRRPTVLNVPAPLLKIAMGEAAQEMLLSGQRVQPKVLCEHGFKFQHPKLEPALRSLLNA